MKKNKVYIGCDPGNLGGISILVYRRSPKIFHIPVIKTKKKVTSGKRKGKIRTITRYDVPAIVDILKPYVDKDVVFALERVSPRPGEGNVSSFNFGTGWGILQGIAQAYSFKLEIVSPISWKNYFPKLQTTEMQNIKESIKLLKKDNDKKKLNKKEIEKLKRSFKSLSKDSARELVSGMYPKMSDKFEKKQDDGIAESLLMALYAKDKL